MSVIEYTAKPLVVKTAKYPEGINVADSYLKSMNLWGVLFGGVALELLKLQAGTPHLRKDIDVYAPMLSDLKGAYRETGIDFWSGIPGRNLGRLRLDWKLNLSNMDQSKLESGLYLLTGNNLLETCRFFGSPVELSNMPDDQEVLANIKQDCQVDLKILNGQVKGKWDKVDSFRIP